MTTDDVIAAYLKLRDYKEQVVQRHKTELTPIQIQLDKCLAWMQQQMQNQGLQNLKGQTGIAFLQTDTTVKVNEWEPFYAWVVANDASMFLEHRAAKSVVKEYMEANNQLPPGLSVSTSVAAHIRKS